jgi:uncharacterized protein YecE (DUF72 family)
MADLKIGTCSWNYDSWVDIVYSKKQAASVLYLPEYSKHFSTAEIDSWFYGTPKKEDVQSYKESVPEDFSFTCKVPMSISLTHKRQFKKGVPLEPNPDFLSVEKFLKFLEAVEPLSSNIDAFMFEFEYLNKSKMTSCAAFIEHLDSFFHPCRGTCPLQLRPGIAPICLNLISIFSATRASIMYFLRKFICHRSAVFTVSFRISLPGKRLFVSSGATAEK